MTIYIEDLKFQAILGILNFEREKPQEIIVNLTINYTFDNANFINYATVANLIEMTMQEQKFLLIEEAINTLSHTLKEAFPTIESLELKITKPTIIQNTIVSVSDIFHFDS